MSCLQPQKSWGFIYALKWDWGSASLIKFHVLFIGREGIKNAWLGTAGGPGRK